MNTDPHAGWVALASDPGAGPSPDVCLFEDMFDAADRQEAP